MSNTVLAVLAVFSFLILTLGAVFATVLSTRGTYYKTLPARVAELEEKDTKSYAEIKQLRAENSTLSQMVTGKAELDQLIILIGRHDTEAAGRHKAMLEALSDIFAAMSKRREEHPRDSGR